MEKKRKPKYDIPLIIVDTRQHREGFQRKEEKAHHIINTKEETIPDAGMLLWQFLLSFQKPLIALKYRLFKLLDKFFEDVEVPWLKIIVLSMVAFMAFKKDITFNLSFNGPDNGALQGGQNGDGNLAKNTTFGAAGNPYAPVAPQSLADKKAIAFIKQYAEVAKVEMDKFGIPASIKMAQALIESNAGSSRLAKGNNNHFGIKCFSSNCKKGHCTNATDDHHKDFFRKYDSAWESWRSHSNLLQSKRYQGLKQYGKNYKKWAKGLKKAGYATDKNYAEKLIETIEKFQLYKLDAPN